MNLHESLPLIQLPAVRPFEVVFDVVTLSLLVPVDSATH